MKALSVLGIMSGTSIDAVDYALCLVSEKRIDLREFWTARFPKRLRVRLQAAARGVSSSHEVGQLHHDLGRFYARHALRGNRSPDLVGLHGQTVFHQPRKPNPATLQLGEPAYLVESIGRPVVSSFRAADLAAGGQGAPLATAFHLQVFGRQGRHVCVQNLGGIGNVTSIDWRKGSEPRVLAFDTGPANMLLDLAASGCSSGTLPMDKDGALAACGKASPDLLARWLNDPFFRQAPPKSTGREYFGERFYQKAMASMQRSPAADVLAAFTELTALSIALNYKLHLPAAPDQLILAGGGAKNRFLVRRIRNACLAFAPNSQIACSEELGWPSNAIEPAAFAWLAFLRWHQKPGNLPGTTGAGRAALLGQISAP